MFYRLRRWLGVQEQSWLRNVRSTPSIPHDPSGPIYVSQIGSVFTDMYLNAVKSIAQWAPPSRVVVLDDGSLTSGDVRLIRQHLPAVDVRPVSGVDVGRCPREGTWERLLTCIDESRNGFVIQVDSDTVTPQRPEAVFEAMRSGASFTMSGYVRAVDPVFATRRLTLDEAAAARRDDEAGSPRPHIQIVAERTMRELDDLRGTYYVRGCSGFAGFAPGAVTRSDVERYSLAMQHAIGDRWTEWGTEQVTSNYVIANAPGGRVLPWPEYVGIMPDLDEARAQMIHFTGEHRFAWGVYRRAAARALEALRHAA
jgi:hypothetical protein